MIDKFGCPVPDINGKIAVTCEINDTEVMGFLEDKAVRAVSCLPAQRSASSSRDYVLSAVYQQSFVIVVVPAKYKVHTVLFEKGHDLASKSLWVLPVSSCAVRWIVKEYRNKVNT